ncbi:uncharacterized protein LOC132270279 [Cornus florida]|uniref:uncharacterized protein LOC132270279 n=1 Tax=Cornus florida TaxID=4283 RepID=UPI00289A14A4|nr:uncharacterized protein LOC132270279 [Cornus florida]
MANHLALVLPKLVGKEQCDFVKGRKIQEAIILAHELVRDFNNPKNPTMALKIDIRKAYDSISWDGFFHPERGLRQGCPLSLILFTLITELFSTLVADAVQRKELVVLKSMAKYQQPISHLFFADDVILACEASIHNFTVLEGIFRRFESVTGLQINHGKSRVLFSRALRRRHVLLQVLKCAEDDFPIKYLGLPLSPARLKRVQCKDLLDKIIKKIVCLNTKLHSLSGRLELLRAVITPIFQYWCCIYDIPVAILNQI